LSGIWSRKFCDPFGLGNGTKIISVFEHNRSRIERFRTPERSDVDEALLNTLRTGDADLRFYITTVQDG
jgi:hypothetical protein